MAFLSENILLFIAAFGTLQGILLALLIYFHPRSDRSVNIFLALYLICFSLIATTPLIQQAVTWQKSFFIEPFPFLAGPLLYFYVRSFKEKIGWGKALPHLVFFILVTFFAYWYIGRMADLYPGEKQVPAEALRNPTAIIFNIVKLGQMVSYYFLTRRELLSYQRSIRQLFSETSRIDLGWIKWLAGGYLVFIVVTMITFGLMFNYPGYFNLWMLSYAAILTPYIYMATFKGITQPTLWQVQPGADQAMIEKEIHEVEEMELAKKDEKPKPSKTSLNESKLEETLIRIIEVMEGDKLYQEPELSLQNLANKLQFPTYQVSQAINEGMKKSFYDLINGYRVEEAKRLLLDSKNRNFTILSVGFEAGFNSKTTFNTVFKKFTGLTPTDFRDQQRKAEAAIA